jgi:hypothetical protein
MPSLDEEFELFELTVRAREFLNYDIKYFNGRAIARSTFPGLAIEVVFDVDQLDGRKEFSKQKISI